MTIQEAIKEILESLKGYISIGYTPRFARELWERIDSFFEKYLPEYAADVSNCQQSSPLPCNIGDTAYCVNGYENKYIESFTVAEIVIRKEGIYLIDTNGAEWLARVCHFSLESAERELKAKKELVNIINENFDKEDIIIHLTYELDKALQSEEVRKDIENYIRRLKEQRSENN